MLVCYDNIYFDLNCILLTYLIGRGRGRGRPAGMASSPRKQPAKKEKASSGEGSDSDFVAESEEEESASEPSDSDYEPDEGFKPKRKVAPASRSSGRRAVSGSIGSRR